MPLKIVIVGGVAGGATAAAKARRTNEQAEIHIYERGEYLSFANCGLPYYIAGEIKERESLLLMTPEKFWEKYRVQAHMNHEVLDIDRENKTIKVTNHKGKSSNVSYDKLILSQGASPIVPPFEGVNLPHVFSLRNVPDVDCIHKYIQDHRPKTAAVIGGGFIGLEMAEAFLKRGITVTVIEKMPHILPQLDHDMAKELEESLEPFPLTLLTGIGASAFTSNTVLLENGEEVPAELVLMSIGVRPETTMASRAGLDIGQSGGVHSNGRMESSDPDIYVVGDAAETTHYLTGARTRMPLAGPANRQGRIAGGNAAGEHMTYSGTLGTCIVRVMEVTAGTVGLNTAAATKAGLSFFTSMTRNDNHASYYPGSTPVVIKVLAEEGTGRLLGAQVIGKDGVDKRVDVLATAIFAKMTVFDLENLDLAYSPPFGSANDPVNMAGFVASHEVKGDYKVISPESWNPAQEILVDVRNPNELEECGYLANAINIPLPELRERLSELPKDKDIVVYCKKGQRGYLATRILMGSGYQQVYNLKGGFLQARLHPNIAIIQPS